MVQEVDVDAVGVVGGADGRDGAQGGRGFAPGPPGHGAAVVDQEDRVEGREEGVGVVGRVGDGAWDEGALGGGAVGWRGRGGGWCCGWICGKGVSAKVGRGGSRGAYLVGGSGLRRS